MLSLRPLLLAVLVLSLLAITTVSGQSPNRVPRSPTTKDQKKLQEILSNVDPASLHDVVHEHIDTYQPSVHEEDKVALAAIHEQKAEVASSLVNLAKRQDVPSSNGTTGSVVSTVTTTSVTTTESTSTVTTPVTSSTSTTESSSSSSLPSSSSTQTTTTPPATQTTPTSSSSSSVTSSNTSSSGPTRTPPSTSQALPTTPLSSTTSTTQSVTSLEIVTTTLPDGAPTTITRTTVVPADQPDNTALGGSSSKTNTAVAGLQTNGASSKRIGMGGITGVILGAAGYLLSGIL